MCRWFGGAFITRDLESCNKKSAFLLLGRSVCLRLRPRILPSSDEPNVLKHALVLPRISFLESLERVLEKGAGTAGNVSGLHARLNNMDWDHELSHSIRRELAHGLGRRQPDSKRSRKSVAPRC